LTIEFDDCRAGAGGLGFFPEMVVFPVVFHQSRLYATNRVRTHIGEVFEIFKASVLALFLLSENLDKLVPNFLAMKPGIRTLREVAT
jgi:hypothetical protein